MKRRLLVPAALAGCLSIMFFAGCGGGGSSKDTTTAAPTLSFGNSSSQKVIDTVATLPGCNKTTASKTFSVMGQTLASAVSIPMTLAKVNPIGVSSGIKRSPTSGNDEYPNSAFCSGMIGSVPTTGKIKRTWSHSGGSTTWTIQYQDFCVKDSQNNFVITNGNATLVQNGSPGTSAPIYRGITFSTDSSGVTQKTYAAANGTTVLADTRLTLGSYALTFGTPNEPFPGNPTSVAPDVETITNGVAVNNLANPVETIAVTGATISSYLDGANTVASITNGKGSSSSLGTFNFSTATPITVSGTTGKPTAGSVKFDGASGSALTLNISPTSVMTFSSKDTAGLTTGMTDKVTCNGSINYWGSIFTTN